MRSKAKIFSKPVSCRRKIYYLRNAMRNMLLGRTRQRVSTSSQTHNMPTPHHSSEQSPEQSSEQQEPLTSSRTNGGESSACTQPQMAVVSLDLRGEFRACNAAFTGLLGYSPQDLRGRDFSTLFASTEKINGDDPSLLRKEILTVTSSRGDYHCRLLAQPKSGARFAVQFSATLLRDSATKATAVIAVVMPQANAIAAATSAASPEASATPGVISRKIDNTHFILASPVMHKFMGLVDRVAGHTETVLITGETGTGKELIARPIHQSSHRSSRPWIDINCAALPENLVESELFGYEKGAFSGADASKPGLFEMADKGTLFLDEIGELQLQTQVKLLRVLDGYPFYRLGGHRKIAVDVRIVAATNQDLDAAVTAGRFRQDLFHRLGQFQLRVPPLRERPEDIVALAEHFLRLKKADGSLAPDAITALLSHGWPGNVRELRNLIARVAVESRQPEIYKSQIEDAMSGNPAAQRQSASMPVGNLDSMEEQMIIRALERSGGHRSQAAEQLGISRRTLSRKLKEYNINVNSADAANSLGFISLEQQKFFRARVQIAVVMKNQHGEEASVQGVNLSTGGVGVDGLKE